MRKSGIFVFATLLFILLGLNCSGPESDQPVLTAEVPLHLEEHLEDARIEGSEVPADILKPVEWSFNEPQPGWKTTTPRSFQAGIHSPKVSQTDNVLKIKVGDLSDRRGRLVGSAYVDVPGWDHKDWAYVVIRARCSGPGELELGFNVLDQEGRPNEVRSFPFENWGEQIDTPLVGDSTVQTYQLAMKPAGSWEKPIEEFGLWFAAYEPLAVEILSVSVFPKEALYAEESAGVRQVERDNRNMRSVFVHTPAQIEFRILVPAEERLDTCLGTLWSEPPTTFRVTVRSDGEQQVATLLEESHGNSEIWLQHSIDLSAYAGQVVTLSLQAESERDGTVALWGAPTLTGAQRDEKPNVIFYVIDGAAADTMSIYGYNRHTTPALERLAAEGAVFEWAYSNSTWTKPSTASFMTSLQNSVMGGQTRFTDPVPDQVSTMAEHMHRAGYQTAVLVANPNAGTLSNLQRGVDLMKESWEEFSYFGHDNHKESSTVMHKAFWKWRESYPGEPYWVHFQTTDVHHPQDLPVPAPFSGLFVSAEELKTWKEWREKLREEGGWWTYSEAWEKTGIDRVAYYTIWQALYDQAMAHNDYQLGRLVQRLKAEGEWENTLLIVAADHSTMSAGADIGVAIQDSMPPRWNMPIFRPSISRIPLMFVWPGRIEGGQRIDHPVSMIDVLPTILDLLDLPLPEVMMGQSLAPLMLGMAGWEPRPVIFDEFRLDQDSEVLRGTIEVVDGRWGASLEINPEPPDKDEEEDEEAANGRRPVPLLLYDLWNDYYCLNSIHEERPDLVEKYTSLLEAQWEVHLALAKHFTRSKDSPLTPEQLETLRSLGYIR